MPRKKIPGFGLEKGRVMIQNGDGKFISPVAMLKSNRGFNRMSAEEMKKAVDRPYMGYRVGQVVEISDETYWD